MASKRRRGDATQPEAERRNKVVATRLDPEARAYVEELAAQNGLGVGQVMQLALSIARGSGRLEASCAEARRWAEILGRK